MYNPNKPKWKKKWKKFNKFKIKTRIHPSKLNEKRKKKYTYTQHILRNRQTSEKENISILRKTEKFAKNEFRISFQHTKMEFILFISCFRYVCVIFSCSFSFLFVFFFADFFPFNLFIWGMYVRVVYILSFPLTLRKSLNLWIYANTKCFSYQ